MISNGVMITVALNLTLETELTVSLINNVLKVWVPGGLVFVLFSGLSHIPTADRLCL